MDTALVFILYQIQKGLIEQNTVLLQFDVLQLRECPVSRQQLFDLLFFEEFQIDILSLLLKIAVILRLRREWQWQYAIGTAQQH